MFGRLGYTFELMGASWRVLKKDKELLVFPLLSGICALIVLASFAIPIIMTDAWTMFEEDATTAEQVANWVLVFLFYFCNYFVIVFFNAGLVACAVIRLRGGDPTVGDGLRAAGSRVHLIAAWALLAATVGVILRMIESRSEKVGAIVAGILGMAWTVLTFLVVPVIVVEQATPGKAFKRSASMLKDTWGQQIVGGFSFGLVFFLLSLVAIAPIALGFWIGEPVAVALGIAGAVIYLLLLGLVQSALQGIFQAAVYLYALEGGAHDEFSAGVMQNAMVSKRR